MLDWIIVVPPESSLLIQFIQMSICFSQRNLKKRSDSMCCVQVQKCAPFLLIFLIYAQRLRDQCRILVTQCQNYSPLKCAGKSCLRYGASTHRFRCDTMSESNTCCPRRPSGAHNCGFSQAVAKDRGRDGRRRTVGPASSDSEPAD